MPHERRHYVRVQFDAPALLTIATAAFSVQVLDLSLKGALVTLPDNAMVPAGMPCQLTVPLAETGDHISMTAGIAHVEVLPGMSLAELRLRLGHAGLVIGVDTGIMHLAAAHYLPMVALFFATPAWRFAPRFNPHAISLGDVGHQPSVGEVFGAATRLLRGNKL